MKIVHKLIKNSNKTFCGDFLSHDIDPGSWKRAGDGYYADWSKINCDECLKNRNISESRIYFSSGIFYIYNIMDYKMYYWSFGEENYKKSDYKSFAELEKDMPFRKFILEIK